MFITFRKAGRPETYGLDMKKNTTFTQSRITAKIPTERQFGYSTSTESEQHGKKISQQEKKGEVKAYKST